MTPPGLLIRPARPAEAARCAGLAAHAFVAEYAGVNTVADVARHLERTCSIAYFEHCLADPTATVLLAQVAGEMAGFVELAEGPTPSSVPAGARQVVRFYLTPRWIGRGVAAPLMAAAIAEAEGRGARHLWLTTWERAPRAIAFYARQGFQVTGDTVFLVGDEAQRDFVLVRPLAGPG